MLRFFFSIFLLCVAGTTSTQANIVYNGIGIETENSMGLFDLVADDQNRIWIATLEGLFIYDGSETKNAEDIFGFDLEARKLHFEKETNTLRVIAGQNFDTIIELDTYNYSTRSVVSKAGVNFNSLVSIDGTVYASALNKVYRLNGLSLEIVGDFSQLEYDYITETIKLDDDYLLVGFTKSGVYKLKISNGSIERYKDYPQRRNDNLAIDGDNLLITLGCDIYIESISTGQITHYPPPDYEDCRTTKSDIYGDYLFIVYNHLDMYEYHLNDGTRQKVSVNVGKNDNIESPTSSVVKIINNDVLVGVHGFGVLVLSKNSRHAYSYKRFKNDQPFSAVQTVTSLGKDNIWIGSNRGLFNVDGNLNLLKTVDKSMFPFISSNEFTNSLAINGGKELLLTIDRDLYVYHIANESLRKLDYDGRVYLLNSVNGDVVVIDIDGGLFLLDTDTYTFSDYEALDRSQYIKFLDNSLLFEIKFPFVDATIVNIKHYLPDSVLETMLEDDIEYEIDAEFFDKDTIMFTLQNGILFVDFEDTSKMTSHLFFQMETKVNTIFPTENSPYIFVLTDAGLCRIHTRTMKISLLNADALSKDLYIWGVNQIEGNIYMGFGYNFVQFFDIENAFSDATEVVPRFSFAHIETSQGTRIESIYDNAITLNEGETLSRLTISDNSLTTNPFVKYNINSPGIFSRELELGINEFFIPDYPIMDFNIELTSKMITGHTNKVMLSIHQNVPFYMRDDYKRIAFVFLLISTMLGLTLFARKYIQNIKLTNTLERIRDCFNESQYPIFCIDENDTIVESNDRGFALLGNKQSNNTFADMVHDPDSLKKWNSALKQVRDSGNYEGTLSLKIENRTVLYHCDARMLVNNKNVLMSLVDFDSGSGTSQPTSLKSHEACRNYLSMMTNNESKDKCALVILRSSEYGCDKTQFAVHWQVLQDKARSVSFQGAFYLLFGEDMGVVIPHRTNEDLQSALYDLDYLIQSCGITFYSGISPNVGSFDDISSAFKDADLGLIECITQGNVCTFVKNPKSTESVMFIQYGRDTQQMSLLSTPVVHCETGQALMLRLNQPFDSEIKLNSSVVWFLQNLTYIEHAMDKEASTEQKIPFVMLTPVQIAYADKSSVLVRSIIDKLLHLQPVVRLQFYSTFGIDDDLLGKCKDFCSEMSLDWGLHVTRADEHWLSLFNTELCKTITFSSSSIDSHNGLSLKQVDILCLNASFAGIDVIALNVEEASIASYRQKGINTVSLNSIEIPVNEVPSLNVVSMSFIDSLSRTGLHL